MDVTTFTDNHPRRFLEGTCGIIHFENALSTSRLKEATLSKHYTDIASRNIQTACGVPTMRVETAFVRKLHPYFEAIDDNIQSETTNITGNHRTSNQSNFVSDWNKNDIFIEPERRRTISLPTNISLDNLDNDRDFGFNGLKFHSFDTCSGQLTDQERISKIKLSTSRQELDVELQKLEQMVSSLELLEHQLEEENTDFVSPYDSVTTHALSKHCGLQVN